MIMRFSKLENCKFSELTMFDREVELRSRMMTTLNKYTNKKRTTHITINNTNSRKEKEI
jgi:hypothetical protein